VKTLPDNPDLKHLRQQAKDLLAGLRDTDPATSLAAAQKSLARQYGFGNWTDLKAEVDRMRGRADVADPARARAVADAFGLGDVTGEMRSMARPDDMGRQWSLTTTRGRWAVRTMDTWWPIVSHEQDAALQEAALAAGVLLPAPVRSRAGNIAEVVEDHVWRAYEWRHSGPPMAAPAGSDVTRELGGIIATLHSLALPVDRVSPWHASRLTPVTWPELAATARDKQAAWASALDAAVGVLEEFETIDDRPGEPVLTHNTIGPGQTRRGPNGRLVVFAWEHAGGQPPSWELGNALMDWAVEPGGGVNTAGARALVEGYRATAGALPELDMAMFRGAVTGLANYVFGQVQGALAAADGFADRSVRHVLANLPTLTTLERLLAAVR
jgi:phosphotransferase family enzyme